MVKYKYLLSWLALIACAMIFEKSNTTWIEVVSGLSAIVLTGVVLSLNSGD